MPFSSIQIDRAGDGQYTIRNGQFYIHSDSISVRVSEQTLTSFDFALASERLRDLTKHVTGRLHGGVDVLVRVRRGDKPGLEG